MSTLTLRDYQSRAVMQCLQKFDDGARRIVLVSPTGSGKTVIAAAFVQALVRRGLRILFLAHRIELVNQAVRRLGVPVSTITAGVKHVPLSQVYVASRDTLVRRVVPQVDFVIIDEAHHATASGYLKILAAVPNAKLLGLTATPCRLDDKGLGELFYHLIEAAKVSKLVADGTLMRPVVLSHPSEPDLGGVKKTGGDFNQEQLEERCNRSELRGDVVKHWLQRARNQPTVVFAVSIAHSKDLAADFTAAGVSVVRVDGKMSAEERNAAIGAIDSGRARVIVNVGILTEGWDFPALAVCVLARPTESLSLLLQMWGRVMRTAPGKSEALVLDHAGNVLRHGLLPWNDVEWTLEKAPKRKTKGAVKSLKNCPKCYVVVASATRNCSCGHQWQAAARAMSTGTEGTLVEVDKLNLLQLARQAVGKAQIYSGKPPSEYTKKMLARIEAGTVSDEYARLVIQHRGSPGKAAHVFSKIYGRWP